jgi:nucleotide-binding universal stress UspA family protein
MNRERAAGAPRRHPIFATALGIVSVAASLLLLLGDGVDGNARWPHHAAFSAAPLILVAGAVLVAGTSRRSGRWRRFLFLPVVLAFSVWGLAQLVRTADEAGVLDDVAILLFVVDAAYVVFSETPLRTRAVDARQACGSACRDDTCPRPQAGILAPSPEEVAPAERHDKPEGAYGWRRILLAIDASSARYGAEAVASALAHEMQALIRVVHVTERELYGGRVFAIESADEAARLVEEALFDLRMAGVGTSGSTTAVVVGRAADCIVEAARSWEADLIVLGAGRSRSPVQILRGRTRQKVIDRSGIPVLVVPTTPRPEEYAVESLESSRDALGTKFHALWAESASTREPAIASTEIRNSDSAYCGCRCACSERCCVRTST